EAALGFEFRIGESFRLGPYVRYAHVFQPTSHELGPADAGFIQLGVSLAYSPKRRAKPADEEPEHESRDEAVEPEPDGDSDAADAIAAVDSAGATSDPVEAEEEYVETVAERELREVAERILFPNGSDEPIVDSMAALVR